VSLGEVALVADPDPDPRGADVEDRVAEVARREVELLEYERAAVRQREGARDVDLAIAADDPAGRVRDRARVEELDAVALRERHHGRHAVARGPLHDGEQTLVVDGDE